MILAPWRTPLARALHRNRSLPHSRYAQLATVDPQGCPHNRSIVFRGFPADTNTLEFITDQRSEKVSQIYQNPWGELCWYFPHTREQFRLAGELQIIDNSSTESPTQTARQHRWQSLSDTSRQQFTWPHPGHPRTGDLTTDVPDPTTPPDSFCLLWLHPQRVDHLELRGTPQNRYCYQQDKNQTWTVQEINP
ncbi:pyridoxamine 5'-phosphate oxidase-like protein [Gloeomargarita lithophora Alchichica-D10]|uniref:Pyridoxamine 5'-phosphate oxidase-like protein n=1 Tax=Gloeomargarita lithophora Alchichica-D10 TaxID=1188229 RepID=A0A1J0ABQ3_9CYAN|nr:Npun_F5749 family FMN-dependent PPOX-type flavoprotein [Gloeomargarita lithophora]APB33355.1 pyridoxamine 5'-phosphate oxidase-like protein [Gloeomargarita lithophora Alchichica-D10]